MSAKPMMPALPICCRSSAFALLQAQARAIESPDALVAGACAIALHQMDDADPARVDAALQKHADHVRRRIKGNQPQAVLAHLHERLFDEEGFRGNAQEYHHPANSYLPIVLQTKRGLPITLSLVYKAVAQRLGLRSWGIALPGHFVAGVECDGATMIVDPFFGGRELSIDEAHARIKQVLGEEAEWSDELLAPTGNAAWLTRILQNLLNTFAANGQYCDVAAMLEMEMLLNPEEHRLQRDLGLVLARCGMSQPATAWLSEYLRNNPDDPQHVDLQQLLDVLGN